MDSLLSRVIEAFGGAGRWRTACYAEAIASADGLAFALKWRPAFQQVHIRVALDRPWASISPIGKRSGVSGILDGDRVALMNREGETIAERRHPGTRFPYGRRALWWDDLDMAYFVNYAFWNYFTLPRLLMNEHISWQQEGKQTLQATFPETIPSHSRHQTFRFDRESELLLQHNYTVDVFGSWARAAQLVSDYQVKDGIPWARRRKVTPMKGDGTPRSGPVLIDIQVHEFSLK